MDVFKKVNIVMSSRSKENMSPFVNDLINSFFGEVKLRGLDKLINFDLSKVAGRTAVGEHSVNHKIILPTNLTSQSFLRCDAYYYRWNFDSKGIIEDMKGVVGVLLLKRVVDVTKTDRKLLDSALSDTMSWASDSHPEEGQEFDQSGNRIRIGNRVRIRETNAVENVSVREERMMKRITSRWKRRRGEAGKKFEWMLGPEK